MKYHQNKLNDLIFKTKVNLEDLWKTNNLINTSIKLPINLKLNSKDTLKIVNLEREMDSQEEIFNTDFSSIKENINNKVTTRSHG